MSSKHSERISNYFLYGITEEDIQAHEKLLIKVRKDTDKLIKRETKKIREALK